MLSEEEAQKRKINYEYWSLTPVQRLGLMIRLGFISDEDLYALDSDLFERALDRAIDNGDLRDLEADILKEKREG